MILALACGLALRCAPPPAPSVPRDTVRARSASAALIPPPRIPAAGVRPASIRAAPGYPAGRLSAALAVDTPRARAREPDAWFAEDKLKHFAVSFVLGSIGYGAARALGLQHGAAIVAASAGTLVVGAGKEVHDRASGGDFSLRDFSWDALGVAAAAGVSAETR